MRKGNEELLQRILDGEQVSDASAEADAIRQLRADLKTLSARVPECQHSKERLREGILQAQLKPAKRSFAWGFALMPVAAAALALLFIRHPQDLPAPRSTEGSTPPVAMATPHTSANAPEASAIPNPVVTTAASEPAEKAHRPVRRTDHSGAKPVYASRMAGSQPKVEAAAGAAGDMAVLEGPGDSARASALMNQEPAAEGPVVIVSPATTDSGTQSAAEVSSTSDVVVGG